MIARRGSIDLGNCTLSPRWSLYLSLSLFPSLFRSSLLRIYDISPLARRSLLSSALASSVLSRVLSPEASHPCTRVGCHSGWVQGHACTPLSLSLSPLSRFFPSILPSFLRRGRGRPRLDRSRRT